MKKGIAPILIIFLGLAIIGGGIFSIKYLSKKDKGNDAPSFTYEVQQKATGQPTQPPNQPTSQPTSPVPLSTEEDVIRNFFQLINEKRIPEAISMMTAEMAGDESSKQAWGVQFNDINSINVLKIEPSMKENWTENKHSYKLTVEVYVSSDAANAPIPYYGWQNGENTRWITLEKMGNVWKIAEIATGP